MKTLLQILNLDNEKNIIKEIITNHQNKPHETKTRNVRHQRLATGHHFPCHFIPNPTTRKTLIMEITIKKQHTETIKFPVPCFWRSHYRWMGLIDENTLVTFADYGDRCEMSSYKLPTPGNVWLEATQDPDFFTLTTEEEFFEAYDKALQSITITPILKTW